MCLTVPTHGTLPRQPQIQSICLSPDVSSFANGDILFYVSAACNVCTLAKMRLLPQQGMHVYIFRGQDYGVILTQFYSIQIVTAVPPCVRFAY